MEGSSLFLLLYHLSIATPSNDFAVFGHDISSQNRLDNCASAALADKRRHFVQVIKLLCFALPVLMRIDEYKISVKSDFDITLLPVDSECFGCFFLPSHRP